MMTKNQFWHPGILFVILLLVGCRDNQETVATPDAGPTAKATETVLAPTVTVPIDEPVTPTQEEGVLISELLPGIPGNNNREFIELYNAGVAPVDLAGWSLWYKLNDSQDAVLVYEWTSSSEIPGWGHFLLLRDDQPFEVIGDAVYDMPLFERRGGLVLRDANDEVVDRLGWGEGVEAYFAGEPAGAPVDGASIERLPGGAAGNGVNSNDNAADFALSAIPSPQNSGSARTPLPDERLVVTVTVPEVVEPGTSFSYTIEVQNFSDAPQHDLVVTISLPADFEMLSGVGAGDEMVNGRYAWRIPQLEPEETVGLVLELQSPFTYLDTIVSGVKVEADGIMTAFAAPRLLSVAGGAIPIAAARGLAGNVVTIEGVATMYTGGFFAGSTGTKFYMEDETGGVQIYVPGGNGVVNVQIGDRVRVTGGVEIYRDSVEVVTVDIEADVEVVVNEGPPEPAVITTADNETNDAVLGKLNQIEGMTTRIEEFSFSYELDIVDETGTTTLVYIEKDTGMTAELLEVGKLYRVTGISEFYSSQRQLKPRLQSDIAEVFPPELLLLVGGPNSAEPEDVVAFEITAVNHTPSPLTNLQISAALPQGDGVVSDISAGGEQVDNRIVWTIDELPGDGESVTVMLSVSVNNDAVQPVVLGAVTAVADQWPDPVATNPFRTFVGTGVPIWAIQGDDFRSPYVGGEAMTQGIVTGVFPELSGFWLQEVETDDDAATSAGIFVLVDQFDIPVAAGDLIQLTGRVRELSGQTALYPTNAEQIEILGSGHALPLPVAYDPPQEIGAALLYNESLEGMLVEVADPALVIAPTTQYGEYTLIHEKWGVDSVSRTDEVGFMIFVDDGSSAAHSDASTLPYAVARGNFVEDVVGPLAYTFDNYKIEPLATPQIYGEVMVLPTLPEAASNQLNIATFNVENLFDTRDPHPSSPERPSRAEYAVRLQKLADTIQAMGAPTVIGLQEVENIGVLEDLLALETVVDYGYAPYLIEGFDSRGIDVGYLVRSDRATVELVTNEGAPEALFSRPPLLLKVVVTLDSGPQTVYFLNNHFLSLSGGEEATEPVRTAQAAWNVERMQEILADEPEAQVVVMGDLNSFYQTLPVNTLQAAGLRHAYEFFGDDAPLPYTYIFEGRTQSLDHILLSEGLFAWVTAVNALHLNANYPIANVEDTTAQRSSDHDPLVIMLTWE